ncbi:MAG TPA: hypothetical protein ENH34_04675 [Phycisphaerales bacterium]|nr:hypothetical protein [Phycisphaerales bacterium]
MKNTSVSICKVMLGAVLCTLVLWLSGCSQPGETTAEGHRRHIRNVRLNQQELVEDIDKAIHADKPSKLSDKRIR